MKVSVNMSTFSLEYSRNGGLRYPCIFSLFFISGAFFALAAASCSPLPIILPADPFFGRAGVRCLFYLIPLFSSVFLSASVFGFFLIPFLFFLRGFSLFFTAYTFRLVGYSAWAIFFLLGISGFFSLLLLFILSEKGFAFSSCLFRSCYGRYYFSFFDRFILLTIFLILAFYSWQVFGCASF